jgi:hypothetical protein
MYMAFGGNITTVTRALMVLGMDTVGHLVVGLKLVDHFHQSTPRRIDAKLELNRALLSGCVARKLTEHAELRGGEEAVVCTLMRQVGKLLVVCYLDSEWDRIRRRAAELDGDDERACVDVLGVSFEAIGLEAAASWRLPDVIRAGMANGDDDVEPDEMDDDADDLDDDRRFAPDTRADEGEERVRWLRAVSRCSTDVASALTTPAGPQRDAHIAALAQRYGAALDIEADALVEIADRLAREEASDTVMREIVELRANADAIARAQGQPKAHRSRPRGPARAAVRTRAHAGARARFGKPARGPRVHAHGDVRTPRRRHLRRAPRLRPGRRRGARPAAVHRALRARRLPSGDHELGRHLHRTGAGPKMAKRLPAWYVDALPDARAFVLLPVRVGTTSVALLYGDWAGAQTARKITQQEMSVLNELARELARFFPTQPTPAT